MSTSKNHAVLQPLIDRFNHLSQQTFSEKREHDIDDLLFEFFRADTDPGIKELPKDKTVGEIRTRSFSYASDDGSCTVFVSVKIFQGQPGKSEFTCQSFFAE